MPHKFISISLVICYSWYMWNIKGVRHVFDHWFQMFQCSCVSAGKNLNSSILHFTHNCKLYCATSNSSIPFSKVQDFELWLRAKRYNSPLCSVDNNNNYHQRLWKCGMYFSILNWRFWIWVWEWYRPLLNELEFGFVGATLNMGYQMKNLKKKEEW